MNKVGSWNLGHGCALIQDLETFARLRETMPGPIGMTSGGFDPVHPGHISSITHASRILRHKVLSQAGNPRLVVVVNGDRFLREKKGRSFMDLLARCQVISGITGVDAVIPYEAEPQDSTVIEAIKAIRPDYFFKGGDRFDAKSIPEWDTCKEIGTEIVTGIGQDKRWSSSNYLGRWKQKAVEDYLNQFDPPI